VILALPPAPPVALTVSPSRLALAAGETGTIEIVNRGDARTTVTVSASGLMLGLRGRPRIVLRPAGIVVRPRRLAVSAGAIATIAVSAPRGSRPGDRPALVLVSTRGGAHGVAVGLRIGVVVLVRGAGPVVRRLVPLAVHARGRTLELLLRNAGNVSERLDPGAIRIRLLRRGHVVARPRAEPRELLPHTRGILRLHVARPLRGNAAALVRILGRTWRLGVKAGRR
jgi:hypothetical protein